MRAELRKLQQELGISFLHVTHGQDEALALADEIVVMNNAVIEQAGPARDVFNAPRTEFVARFMGGHNVIALPDGHFAIRSDAIGLTSVEAGTLEASVMAIEYQGTHVSVTARTIGHQDITALVADSLFFEQPRNPGDRIGLAWDNDDLHALAS
jgi:putative spermidine/putrescine transport system ATP-binding protein